jgi:hypothetical protein
MMFSPNPGGSDRGQPVAVKVKHGRAKFEIAAILGEFVTSIALNPGNHGANSVIAVRKNSSGFGT